MVSMTAIWLGAYDRTVATRSQTKQPYRKMGWDIGQLLFSRSGYFREKKKRIVGQRRDVLKLLQLPEKPLSLKNIQACKEDSNPWTMRWIIDRASCKPLKWDKVSTIRGVCIVYRIVFLFHLAKLINHPNPGWDRLFLGALIRMWQHRQPKLEKWASASIGTGCATFEI